MYRDKHQWKHSLIPIEISRNDSDGVVDIFLYKNPCDLFKKFNAFLGDHHKKFICRRCLILYEGENMLTLHKPKSENFDITINRTSSASHLLWKNHSHKILIDFRIFADFDADKNLIFPIEVIKQLIIINKTQYSRVII